MVFGEKKNQFETLLLPNFVDTKHTLIYSGTIKKLSTQITPKHGKNSANETKLTVNQKLLLVFVDSFS